MQHRFLLVGLMLVGLLGFFLYCLVLIDWVNFLAHTDIRTHQLMVALRSMGVLLYTILALRFLRRHITFL